MQTKPPLYGRSFFQTGCYQKMVDDGAYFTINKARQYGKTTMLQALAHYLLFWYQDAAN